MIKATLSENSFPLKVWEQPCHTDLPALLQAAKFIKHSINDYLTRLICQNMDDLMELTENSEVEEDIKDYGLSDLINNVGSSNRKTGEEESREIVHLNQRKKVKK